MKFKFPKREKLTKRKDFQLLKQKGKKLTNSKFYSYYLIENVKDSNIKVAFLISKRKIKKATKRNLVRRRMKEAFRLNVPPLREKLKEKNICAKLVIIYPYSYVMEYDEIQKGIIEIINKLMEIVVNCISTDKENKYENKN